MEKLKHWTSRSAADFAFKISSDFVAQLETKLEEAVISRTELADRLGVTAGRVSQVLNNPGNFTIANAVRFARAFGMKVALVAYDDGDPENRKGPVNSAIFEACWKELGAPNDFFALSAATGAVQIGGRADTLRIRDWYYSAKSANGPNWRILDPKIMQTDNSGWDNYA